MMRSIRKLTLLALLAGVLALGLAACGSGSGSISGASGIKAPPGVQTPAPSRRPAASAAAR